MSTLRERLEKKISDDEARYGRVGTASLVPLVCELAEALEKCSERKSPSITASTIYSYESMADHAKEALQAIEKFVGDEG